MPSDSKYMRASALAQVPRPIADIKVQYILNTRELAFKHDPPSRSHSINPVQRDNLFATGRASTRTTPKVLHSPSRFHCL
ncbi:hypothetical protein TWF718_009669 [Orbilia javanica]|uniref:Uncharacterized protein n=1 Tax=Orbilia javanica TaxID=47235 RepID=A0AAN8REW9_9PEZI